MDKKKEYVKLWLSYESYFEPYSDVEVGRLVRAMIQYKSSGEDPEFNGNERYVWPAIKRDIDGSTAAQEATTEKNRENGSKGGRPKKKEEPTGLSKNPENPVGFSETQKSQGQRTKVKDKGQGKGKGQKETDIPLHTIEREDEGLACVMSCYLDKINPTPSASSLEDLKFYCQEMGAEVCLRAIDKALDAGSEKANWNYIRGILRGLMQQGVRCIADWDRLEEKRVDRKKKSAQPMPQPTPGGEKDRLLKLYDTLKKDGDGHDG